VAVIRLEGVNKVYGDGTHAVRDLDLEIGDGEFVVFVGPSGCGKTSALRMIAGLEEISGGTVSIGDEVVNDLPPKDRDLAMVFQNYALYPHMSAYDNMAFALKMRGLDKAEIRRRVEAAAKVLGLADVLKKRPRTLSGGQRQRVAMGRAIVREPRAFLMDEPLSNLDAKLRVQMRAEIARIQRDLAVTTIYVTHDQSEAMTLGDRVAVMRKGVLQQLAAPQELYAAPVNLFVAEFIGSPAMNVVEGRVEVENGSTHVVFGSNRLRVQHGALAAAAGRTIAVGIRPEDMTDAALDTGEPDGRTIDATVDLREDMGSDVYVHFRVDATAVLGEDVRDTFEEAADATALEAQAERGGTPFVARVGRESRAREGERARLVVDTRKLHFFDLASGEAIGRPA
jgi:multiple sugar transport system ATP-binding protein